VRTSAAKKRLTRRLRNAGAIRSMLGDAEKKAEEEAAGSPSIFSSAIKV
jgi:hypothetical protein